MTTATATSVMNTPSSFSLLNGGTRKRKHGAGCHNDRFAKNDISSSSLEDQVRDSLTSLQSVSPESKDYAKLLRSKLGLKKQRLLSFKNTAASVRPNFDPVSFRSSNGISKSSRSKPQSRKFRHIQSSAVRVLDAPDLVNDFYMTHCDWGHNNVVSVALNDQVYLWNAESCSISALDSDFEGSPVTSVKFSPSNVDLLSVASKDKLFLFDSHRNSKIRNLRFEGRTNVCEWKDHILISGGADGIVSFHDVRVAQSLVNQVKLHDMDVCSLKVNGNGSKLATGGNDDKVCVFDFKRNSLDVQLTGHSSAVKALAWNENILCTGGGRCDKTLRLWNCSSGRLTSSLKVGGGVSGVEFSKCGRELVCSIGSNVEVFHRGTELQLMKRLKGHDDKILTTTKSPCNSTMLTCSSDETLRFWNIFESKSEEAKQSNVGGLKNDSKSLKAKELTNKLR